VEEEKFVTSRRDRNASGRECQSSVAAALQIVEWISSKGMKKETRGNGEALITGREGWEHPCWERLVDDRGRQQ